MKNLSKVLNEKDIATKEYVDTASSNKANIDSPVFTGKPKAPTPTPISAGTQIATKAYVDPVALDTTNTYTYSYFKSLADHNKDVIINGYKVSRMWTDNIKATFDLVESFNVTGCFTYYYNGNKWEYENMTLAPIESPTFTGKPTAPTPTNDSDGTQIATKEYVVARFNNFVPTKIKNQNNVGISIWTGTQEEYNALTTKDANTLYLVKSS